MRDVAGAILPDVFALCLKTKNFHWHIERAALPQLPLAADEQAEQLFAMTDPTAERIAS